jgi:hypothetical protein
MVPYLFASAYLAIPGAVMTAKCSLKYSPVCRRRTKACAMQGWQDGRKYVGSKYTMNQRPGGAQSIFKPG